MGSECSRRRISSQNQISSNHTVRVRATTLSVIKYQCLPADFTDSLKMMIAKAKEYFRSVFELLRDISKRVLDLQENYCR